MTRTRIEDKKDKKEKEEKGVEDVLSPSALSARTPLIMGFVFLFSFFLKLQVIFFGNCPPNRSNLF